MITVIVLTICVAMVMFCVIPVDKRTTVTIVIHLENHGNPGNRI